LVIETRLGSLLRESLPTKASPETAAKTAAKAHAKYVTYYTLEKPPIQGFEMPQTTRLNAPPFPVRRGTNGLEANGDFRGHIEADARQRRLEQLSKSPEQQAQRARQRKEADLPQ